MEHDPRGMAHSIRRHLAIGFLICAVLLIGVGGWAGTTRISAAIVTSGHFVVDSHVKKVQHPSGGIVGAIRVREGDLVRAGDILMRLDATQARANLAIVSKRLDELRARLARLEAERDDSPHLTFPPELLLRADAGTVEAAMASETRLFSARREGREVRKSQLLERIAQFRHEMEGLKSQELAYAHGLEVLQSEISAQESLHAKGAVSVQRLNSLLTQAATFGGERGEKIAYQAQVEGRITETRLQILQIDQDLKSEVGRELREIQAEIGEFVERQIAAEDDLKRLDILSPANGRVHQLAVHTIGGVVSPADPIMLIVPEHDPLTLELRLQPKDIDQVQPGQAVRLRLSAFSQRKTPELDGHVSFIAADLTTDPASGMAFYQARVVLEPGQIERLGPLVVMPGMPAEAMIKIEDRSVLSYLVKPLSDQLQRAFREE